MHVQFTILWISSAISAFFNTIVLIMTIIDRTTIDDDTTYDIDNPFVSFTIRYFRAFFIFFSVIAYLTGFFYSV